MITDRRLALGKSKGGLNKDSCTANGPAGVFDTKTELPRLMISKKAHYAGEPIIPTNYTRSALSKKTDLFPLRGCV